MDVGMPVVHGGVRYNCRVILLNGKILLIRPKMYLADDGNYRETRYFAAWKKRNEVESYLLPTCVANVCSQRSVPFGDAALRFLDTLLAPETCEELFTPDSPHIGLSLAGVEIISNGSGSHHQLRKLDQRLDLIKSATAKAGGIYLYANQRGCDGNRLYFDGCSCVAMNGHLLAQGSQFSVKDVEVVCATVDLDAVVGYRGAVSSLREQASFQNKIPFVDVDFALCSQKQFASTSTPTIPRIHTPEEEIAYGPAAWLWDYLRRSGASGYLLPLSGGADSASTAAIVRAMCQMVVKAAVDGDAQVSADIQRIMGSDTDTPLPTARELAKRLFITVYMGTVNSSIETQTRAAKLAEQVGAYHMDVKVDSVVSSLTALFTTITGRFPHFKVQGGTHAENLALQNIQARLRMVLAFLLAQLMPWVRGVSGFLLVLGSANVDECLRGYVIAWCPD